MAQATRRAPNRERSYTRRSRPHVVAPPPDEQALGLRSYLTSEPGIGGRLRSVPEDFVVLETGDGPARDVEGKYTAARIALRNWETNRFAGVAARELGIHRDQVAFAGMKDKRAVTEQWFTFKAPVQAVERLGSLADVRVVAAYATRRPSFTGAHTGNGFVLRIRDASATAETLNAITSAIEHERGVPHFFGPQRFGGHFRATTHLVGEAICRGDLEEAVRLYVGHPVATETPEAQEARRIYEETRDPTATLAAYPAVLDPERAILRRLVERPGDFRYALFALPTNLLQLFIHAWQSLLFNEMLSARLEAGLGLATAHVGDRVMGVDDEGTTTHVVTAYNRARVQQELDRGRAVLTAALTGLTTPLAEGVQGDIETEVLDAHGVHPTDFRVREMPELASPGRRRAILQRVTGLQTEFVDGDPVLRFQLGKGSYATVVLREYMKAPLKDY